MSEPLGPAAPPVAGDEEWQRLDPRMLLVHPVREVVRFLPALVAIVLAGTASGGVTWQVLGVVVPVALGLLRYLTTRFRIADGRVELSRGLLQRRVTSVAVDRVRTVDLTASLVQRVLGLVRLRIGTGVAANDDGDALELDGLPADRAEALRDDLLRVAPAVDQTASATKDGPAPPVATFDPRWLRFAPLTGTGLVVVAAAVGGATQLLDAVGLPRSLDRADLRGPGVVGAVGLLVAVLVGLLLLTVLGYLVTNGGYRLEQTPAGWRVRRGLLTTRDTTIDDERLAGVALGEPLALRVAGGRHLQAIVTGVDRSETGSSMLVPPSDAAVAPRVARTLLGHAGPVDGPLRDHGPAAARRRWTRAVVPVLVVLVAAVAAVGAGAPWWLLLGPVALLPAALVVAADRVRGLGHALLEGHLVARSGSLARRREALGTGHVIGWTFRDTWFQRRVGLTTLGATTAGGRGAVTVLDVPEPDAVAVADAARPGLVAQFVR
ncbi:PH domain-containing protein [Nocardioides litoris]|uniref:PH domain-containing protein n=1 Tax=Nocardioides litoris TaxID=1926648 RepID=UPI00111F91FC|nr:PH domain-containing protein [Nocardioides litoris]